MHQSKRVLPISIIVVIDQIKKRKKVRRIRKEATKIEVKEEYLDLILEWNIMISENKET